MGNEKDRSLYREYSRETLTSKVVMELEKTEDILRNRALKSEQEKEKLQKTISEIAHQVKTPLSNICMYHDMLSDPDISSVRFYQEDGTGYLAFRVQGKNVRKGESRC